LCRKEEREDLGFASSPMLYESEEVDILMTRRGERRGVGREWEVDERAERVLASPTEVAEVCGLVVEGEQARLFADEGIERRRCG
jgi:hypothetical protein